MSYTDLYDKDRYFIKVVYNIDAMIKIKTIKDSDVFEKIGRAHV